MPRRRCLRSPDGWVQIIRGPRPPTKWPVATATRQSTNTVKKQGDVGGAPKPQLWREDVGVHPRVLPSSKERCKGLETPVARGDRRCRTGTPSHRTGLSVRAIPCTGALVRRCPQRIGADPPRSAPRAAQWPRVSSQHRRQHVLHLPKTVSGVALAVAQPFTLDSRRRRSRRSQGVAGRHLSSRREQCPREGPPRSLPRCSEQSQVATNPGAVGVEQDVPRMSTEAGFSEPRL